ncbi:unnamed protein product [Effrenium voratum]|nr:unnamed protein product [Effrenium voratum]
MGAEQVHVSVVGPGSVSIGWAVENATVEIQELDNEPIKTIRISPESQRYDIQCGHRNLNPCERQRYRSPLLFQARADLEPGRRYRFRLSGPSGPGRWRHLRTPPAAGAKELRVAVLGDVGQTNWSAATCRDIRAQAEHLDFGVLLGDLAYADGRASRWDSFQRLFDSEGCAEIPWLVLPGNHEAEPDEISGEPFLPFRRRWRFPEAAPEQVTNDSRILDWRSYELQTRYDFGGSFFSFRSGPAHFVALNPYTDASASSPQIRWLADEVRPAKTGFLVVLTHAPWVHTSRAHQPQVEAATRRLRDAAQPLLRQADLVFSGHVHAYERSEPVDGVRHFVVGHGGNFEKLYDTWRESPFTAFRSGAHYGWGVLTLREDGGSFQARRSIDGAIMDSVDFVRSKTPPDAPEDAGGETGLPWAAAVALVLCVVCSKCCAWFFYRRYRRQQADEEEKSSLNAEEKVEAGRGKAARRSRSSARHTKRRLSVPPCWGSSWRRH